MQVSAKVCDYGSDAPEVKWRLLPDFRKIAIDPAKTPFLNWSWKVSDPLVGNDENAKSGDDFSARLYVVVERDISGSLRNSGT